MLTFSHQAQLTDLGISFAFNCANMAMSSAFAAVSLALTVPLAFAAATRPGFGDARLDKLLAPANDDERGQDTELLYSAYRSDGGHATTLVVMGQMPTVA